MSTPAAIFPADIATLADIGVAQNRARTTLNGSINDSQTTLTIASAAGFSSNMILTIENEQIFCANLVGNVYSNCIRGFSGTTPAPHASGRTVSAFITAYHHNRLAAEVVAIQESLGANLSLVQPSFRTTFYDFPAQSPGGSLVVGPNTITLSPVPEGVNAAPLFGTQYLYISGGVGAAEAVPITGGTAVAGAASGTVIVTCANTHSGAWTIRSATAGIKEAIETAVNGGEIAIPAGNHITHAPATHGPNHRFTGYGKTATTITHNHATLPALQYITAVQGSGYDVNSSIRYASMKIVGKNAIGINAFVIPSFQGTVLHVELDDMWLYGTYAEQADPDKWSNVVPTLTGLRGMGVGFDACQCFEFTVTRSIIQNFGIGVYLSGDENVIDLACRLSFNAVNVYIDGQPFGANANKILNSVVSANCRMGNITLHTAAHTLIKGNYQENYTHASQFVRSINSTGTMYCYNRIDDPNNPGLAQVMTGVPQVNVTPIMYFDDFNSVEVTHNQMNIGNGEVPPMSFGYTNWSPQRPNIYRVYDNNQFWPTPDGLTRPVLNYDFPFLPGVLLRNTPDPYLIHASNVPNDIISGASSTSFASTWKLSAVTGRWVLNTGSEYVFLVYLRDRAFRNFDILFVARALGAGTAPVVVNYRGASLTNVFSGNLSLTATTEVETKKVTVALPGGEHTNGRLEITLNGVTAEYEQIHIVPVVP